MGSCILEKGQHEYTLLIGNIQYICRDWKDNLLGKQGFMVRNSL